MAKRRRSDSQPSQKNSRRRVEEQCSLCKGQVENIPGQVCTGCGLFNSSYQLWAHEAEAYMFANGTLEGCDNKNVQQPHSSAVRKSFYDPIHNVGTLLHPSRPDDGILSIIRRYMAQFRTPCVITTMQQAYILTKSALAIPERVNKNNSTTLEYQITGKPKMTNLTEEEAESMRKMTPNSVHHVVRGVFYHLGDVARLSSTTVKTTQTVYQWAIDLWYRYTKDEVTKKKKKKSLPASSIVNYILRNLADFVEAQNHVVANPSDPAFNMPLIYGNLSPASTVRKVSATYLKGLKNATRRQRVTAFLWRITRLQHELLETSPTDLPNVEFARQFKWSLYPPLYG